jgi:hypothetical protein
LRDVKAVIARGSATAILLMQNADARIAEAFDDLFGMVAGAIVHHNDLEILASLFEHRPDRSLQNVRAVENGDDDGEERGHGVRVSR